MSKELITKKEIPVIIQQKVGGDLKILLTQGGKIVKVENEGQAQNALALVKSVKLFIKEVEEKENVCLQPFEGPAEKIKTYFGGILDELEALEKNIKNRLGEYDVEQKRLKREADERREREKRAEEKKRQEEADKKRRDAEEADLKAKAAAIKGDSEAAAKFNAEAQALADDADATEFAPPPPAVQDEEPPPAKLAGFSTRITYSAETVNELQTIQWAAQNQEWGLLTVNEKAMNKLASAKGEFFKVPGQRLEKKTTQVVKG